MSQGDEDEMPSRPPVIRPRRNVDLPMDDFDVKLPVSADVDLVMSSESGLPTESGLPIQYVPTHNYVVLPAEVMPNHPRARNRDLCVDYSGRHCCIDDTAHRLYCGTSAEMQEQLKKMIEDPLYAEYGVRLEALRDRYAKILSQLNEHPKGPYRADEMFTWAYSVSSMKSVEHDINDEWTKYLKSECMRKMD